MNDLPTSNTTAHRSNTILVFSFLHDVLTRKVGIRCSLPVFMGRIGDWNGGKHDTLNSYDCIGFVMRNFPVPFVNWYIVIWICEPQGPLVVESNEDDAKTLRFKQSLIHA